MGKYRGIIGWICFIWVIYFVVSVLVGTNTKKVESEKELKVEVVVEYKYRRLCIPLEEYIKRLLPSTIDIHCEKEVLKAQAVILRSGIVYKAFQTKENNGHAVKKMQIMEKQLGYKSRGKDYFSKQWKKQSKEYFEKIQQAVDDTRGIVLIHEGQLIPGAFTRLSAMKTRENVKMGYLKAVDCKQNIEEKNYLSYMDLDKDVHAKILQKDEAGYVDYVLVDGRIMKGDSFCKKYKLASTNFIINNHQVKCKGRGHGYGMDQYFANQLVKNKTAKTYMDLMQLFFEDISFEKYN